MFVLEERMVCIAGDDVERWEMFPVCVCVCVCVCAWVH